MRGRLAKLLMGISLVLMAAVAAICFVSYWHQAEWMIGKQARVDWIVSLRDGQLVVARQAVTAPASWTGNSTRLGVFGVDDGQRSWGQASISLRHMRGNLAGFGHDVLRPVIWINRPIGGPVMAKCFLEFWMVPLWLLGVIPAVF